MEADRDDDDERSPFRWLLAARFAAAAAMTALVLLVLVKAITVVHRVETQSLSLVQGAIFAKKAQEIEPPVLFLFFNLRASNPSNRARVYYDNVTAYLFGMNASAASSDPAYDSFMYFHLPRIELQQEGTVDSVARLKGTRQSMENSTFDMLYSGTDATISDVTMRLEGNLITEVLSGANRSVRTSHYCWPLVVGVDTDNVEQFLNFQLKDVFCREVQSKHFI